MNLSASLTDVLAQGKAILQDEKKRANLLLAAGIAGMLLLAISAWLPAKQPEKEIQQEMTQNSTQEYATAMEQRLQAMIEQVDGAGKTSVMVTLANGEERVYAIDSQTSEQGSNTKNYVLIGGDGLVCTVQMPQVLGVAVVCQGGENPCVQSRVTILVQALTDVGSNHITVTGMAPD